MFNSFEFKFKPISLPLFSENDFRDNELLKELKEYFDASFSGMILFSASCIETPLLFYKDVLLTDLVMEIDSVHRLPPSMYALLYAVATSSRDELSSIRANEVLLGLMTRHASSLAEFKQCIPSATELCDLWNYYGLILFFRSS